MFQNRDNPPSTSCRRSHPVRGPSWRNPSSEPWVAFSPGTARSPSRSPLTFPSGGLAFDLPLGREKVDVMVEEIVARLTRDGYATVPGALEPDQVAAAKADLEAILERTPSGRDDFEGP